MDGLLKEHVKKLKPKTAAHLWGKYAGGYTDALNHVLPILDEAKKDWETPDKIFESPPSLWLTLEKEHRTKWFNKYFGDTP